MKSVTAITACALIAASMPAYAAQDLGLSVGSGRSSVASSGFGAQASVVIKFGDKRTVPVSEKVAFGIAASPVVSLRDGRSPGRVRDHISPTLGLTLRPGYSTTLDMAGQPLLTEYTRMGAAEESKKSDESDQSDGKKKQDTGDKIAWVALVAGGVMVALIGAAAIAFATQGPTD